MKIGFVILHYMEYQITEQCVQSIQKNVGTKEYQIVIVDNKSPDNSGEHLKKYYEQDNHVHIILNDKNDGFARGNNIGYRVLREKCEFICILNNDVELIEPFFIQHIESLYVEYKFAILGPRIKLLDGSYYDIMSKVGSYKEERKKYRKKYLRYLIALVGLNRCREFLGCRRNATSTKSKNRVNCEHRNIILHGCVLIYSPQYIKSNEWAFDPRTEFYGEEALLYLHLKKTNMNALYSPKITILHKESIATIKSKRNYKKTIFQLRNTVKSQKILISELKK